MAATDITTNEIHKLVVTIRDLLRQSKGKWVHWKQVAKKYRGSPEYAVELSGLAELPKWKELFATKQDVVTLTEKGLTLANSTCAQSLTEMQKIAKAVIRYASRLKPIRLWVEKVCKVATVQKRVVQAVHVDVSDDPLPSDAPVHLRPNGARPIHGKIVGQEIDGSILYVAFETEVCQEHLPATLWIERGFLLTRLASQLDTLPSLPHRMRPLLDNRSEGCLIADHNSLDVTSKLASLQIPWTRMLWGPPGAGKTFALGHLVATLLTTDPQATILLVAPSNRAVDVALEAVVERLRFAGLEKLIQDRRILRFGYPRKAEIIEQPELLGPAKLDDLNKKVKQISRRIQVAEKKERNDVDLALLRTELLDTQEKVTTAVAEHVKQVAVVATTTTLAYLPSPVSSQEWSTVLVDEVTMVTPAMCVFLSSRAKDRFLLAGDPRQLGPVYDSGDGDNLEDFEWMGRDIFDKSGVSSGNSEERQIKPYDTRMARITSQRRCVSGVWNRVKHLYPEIADATNHESLQHLVQLVPSPGEAVVCLDTSSVQAKCERYKGSWQNPLSAEVALDLAKTIVAESVTPIRIAIITPYRAQVRLLRHLLREERKAETTPYGGNQIEAGTVHQFQGSDADVVIFDVVDGQGRNDVGKLLRNDDGIRLVNVAITRAKGKLIVLADKEWCKRVRLQEYNALLYELVLGNRPTKTLSVQRRLQAAQSPPPGECSSERDKTESPIEMALFDAMATFSMLATVRSQVLIRDQAGIPISRADFAFEALRYAIYCDGRKWHLKEDRWEVDLRQRNKLAENGWIFSVFSGSQILKDAASCAAQIAETYTRRLDGEGGTRPKTKEPIRGGTNQVQPMVVLLPKNSQGNDAGNSKEQTVAENKQEEGSCKPEDIVPAEKPESQLFTNTLGIQFTRIPHGSFMMGSPATEEGREGDEPQHKATLSKGYFMSVKPITQAQWKAVMGVNLSQFQGDTLPVERVSWGDCDAFCKKLSEVDGKHYRLPTEAEWEWACRAGTSKPFYFGGTISTDQANFDGNYIYGNGKKGKYRTKTTPVDEFPPNFWGLFDLHGNVWEWCSDWYGIYPTEDFVDYQGPANGTERVIRGGAYGLVPKRCRSAQREHSDPRKGRKDVGFRLCFSEG